MVRITKWWNSNKAAIISDCSRYRYILSRVWDREKPFVLFIMFNPSTADALTDDHTIRKCIGFADRWGYGGLIVVNLYALRCTDPKQVFKHSDPFGPDNAKHVKQAVKLCTTIVCAWGCEEQTKRCPGHINTLLRLLSKGATVKCLGTTKDGTPRHPLMLAYDTQLEKYEGVAIYEGAAE